MTTGTAGNLIRNIKKRRGAKYPTWKMISWEEKSAEKEIKYKENSGWAAAGVR